MGFEQKWTKEQFWEEAANFESPSHMAKANRKLYRAGLYHGWVQEYPFPKRRICQVWTKERFFQEAVRYDNPWQMRKGNHAAFKAGENNGWLDEFPFPNRWKGNDYWTKERCYSEAMNYSTKSDFHRGEAGAYTASLLNGWIDDYKWFTTPSTTRNRFVYSYEFEELNTCYVGLTINPETRHIQHCGGGGYKAISSVLRFAKEHNISVPKMKILCSSLTAEDAQIYEDFYKQKYIQEGWNCLNRAKTGKNTGSLGGNNYKWSKESCRIEAERFKNKKDFHMGSSSAYSAAWKNGWLFEFFPDSKQPTGQRPSGYWDDFENVAREAQQFKTKSDFRRANQYAARKAVEHGWMDRLFQTDLGETSISVEDDFLSKVK